MLYVLRQRVLWGDYGGPLISGHARREEAGGPLLLERSGPFLPPISFPWSSVEGARIVVSTEVREQLEALAIEGMRFGPTEKRLVVRINWHLWDLDAPEPEYFPDGGEPEGYLLNEPNDLAAAEELPEAWECFPPIVPCRISSVESANKDRCKANDMIEGLSPDFETLARPQFFTQRPKYGFFVVNDLMRLWLEGALAGWITIKKVDIKV